MKMRSNFLFNNAAVLLAMAAVPCIFTLGWTDDIVDHPVGGFPDNGT